MFSKKGGDRVTMRAQRQARARKDGFAKKRRRRSIIAFDMIHLDRSSNEPLHQQLYRQIRDELRSGSFSNNASRLPSSRSLAAGLRISRITVGLAFAKLRAEGYLESKIGSGTFLVESLPESFLSSRTVKMKVSGDFAAHASDRANKIPDERTGEQFDLGAPGARAGTLFVAGIPAADEFPIADWERVRAQVLARKGSHLLRYASNRGDTELRKAIAAYLCDFRGARCHPDQIVIMSGMQQAMLVCAMVLLNPGENIWMEDPGFHQARRVFLFAGANVVPRPVDEEGITIEEGARKNPPKIIFVTPSHQFPLGVTMSLKRRIILIDFARENDAYILEDDYDSEFRFSGSPLPCLQGLDNAGRVIYAGTMSKILFPSLRLGYLLVPEQLVDTMAKVRAVMDQHSPAIDQATLARFLTEGFFLSHVKRMRKIYAERRDFFIREFNRLLGDRFILEDTEAGLHFVAWLRNKADARLITRIGAGARN